MTALNTDQIPETIKVRHSVRAYTQKPLGKEAISTLEKEIAACNSEGNLSISLVCDEPEAFNSTTAHYGKFQNVQNYLIMAGPDSDKLDELCGYYGQRLVLLAQQLGLNTCWVALTFKRRFVKKFIEPGHRLVLVISLGYGQTQGIQRKSKRLDQVSICKSSAPERFVQGINAALLAPTAMNQQNFVFELLDETDSEGKPLVRAFSKGGAYSKVDLGIVKLHFELIAGLDNFSWA